MLRGCAPKFALDVVRAARFVSAFTFQYSPRPGTPAASMPDPVPREVVSERYQRLVAVQEEISWELNRALVGRTVEVLVAELVDLCFEHKRVEACRVSVLKPDIFNDAAAAGVEAYVRRADHEGSRP